MAKKSIKGLFSDSRPIDQPEGTYPYGKNGIQDFQKLATINEPGFTKIDSVVIPYTHMGTIETDLNPIIFSTDDTNSAIGFFDPINKVYTPIFDDTALDFKIGFKRANYITGEYQKNQLGEYIAVFTDKVLPFRYINCTNPSITKADDLLFFLRATAPTMNVSTQSGGQLPTGGYVIYLKYARVDGSETAYLISSAPIVVSGVNGSGISSEAISIALTGCDITYDYIIIGVISSVAGVTSAVELTPVGLTPSMNILYTGTNTVTPSTTDEILIQPAVYSRVGTLTQLNDALYLGNLQQLPPVNYQPYANLIQVRWVSQNIDLNNTPPTILNGLEKGFAHGEVYALYIRLKMTDGTKSPAFIIPGRPARSGETDSVTDGGITALKFQIHDTPVDISIPDSSGGPCYWQNGTELYPDDPNYDSTALGGENLRGTPVRHHKMPTHNWIMNNFNTTNPAYGKSTIDILGIKLSGIVIPAEIVNNVDSYEILYAQRTVGNATVLGQSEVIYAAQSLGLKNAGAQANFTSSGGNWKTVAAVYAARSVDNPSDAPLAIVNNRIRMHPFEMLFNNTQIPESNCYLQLEWRMSIGRVTNRLVISYGVETNVAPGDRADSDGRCVAYILDYKSDAYSQVRPIVAGDFIRGFKDIQYALVNTNSTEWNNANIETSVVGTLLTAGPTVPISAQTVAAGAHQYQSLNTNNYVQSEDMMIGTIRIIRTDVYDSVLSQSLVSTGISFKVTATSTPPIYAGDVFPCDYTVNNYGWINDYNLSVGNTPNLSGTKVIRRFVCESIANINQRFEITGNQYSKWYPQDPAGYENSYIMSFDRTQNANQPGYSKDLNSLNNLENISTFSPYIQTINIFPYRIHRGGVFQREGMQTAWRTLLPLDYYDMPKNKGVIVNLAGLNDNLLIHHQDALFITQDKTTLKGDVLSVTLGTGDIFQYVPLEGLQTKLGYGGTRHDLAAIITPTGYIFADTDLGQIFLFKGSLKLLNAGLNVFLKQYLNISENNPYIGNGITMGYDPKYNRILMTVKNAQVDGSLSPYIVPGYAETQAFFDTLVAGQSIVYNNGTWMRFMGANTTEFDCPAVPDGPTVDDATFTIPESDIEGDIVGAISWTSYNGSLLTWVITSGNTSGAFTINPAGALIVAANVLNFSTTPVYTLGVKVIDINGNSATATVTVNITSVPQAPSVPSYNIFFDEKQANGTNVQLVAGTDPRGLSLTYSILSGNDLGTFAINSTTGQITVADTTSLVYTDNPVFYLTVRATNTDSLSATGLVTINLNDITAPVFADQSASIINTTAAGTVVITGTPGVDTAAAAVGRALIYSIVANTDPTAFNVGLDPTDPATFLIVTVATGASLTVSTYTITIRCTDTGDPGQSPTFADADYTIAVTGAYSNVRAHQLFTKDDCTSGESGTTVDYIVPAGTYTSSVSQADADSQAAADIAANGQAYADANGMCVVDTLIGTLLIDYDNDTSVDLCFYIDTVGVAETGIIVASTANGGPLQYPNDGRDPSACVLLSSDKLLPGPPIRRFLVNMAYLISTYPAIDHFTFHMRGRTNAVKSSNGSYVLRTTSMGHMIMSVYAPGMLIPAVPTSSTSGIVSYTTNLTAGANGVVGTTVGALVLTLDYIVSTNTLTKTTY